MPRHPFVIPDPLFVMPHRLFVIPNPLFVIPVTTGIQALLWIPAFAGKTSGGR